jgi:hypothetical protein
MPVLTREEIARSLTAAWQVFLDRPDAVDGFDVSIGGFWRSFRAIILVAPAYALSAVVEKQVMLAGTVGQSEFDDGLFVIAKTLTLALDWVALPVLLALVATQLRLTGTYAAFVVVRNWASVIAILPFAAIALLYVLGIFDEEAANIASLTFLIVIFRYNYLIARRALSVGIGLAIGLVIVDFVLSFAIAAGVDTLMGLPP